MGGGLNTIIKMEMEKLEVTQAVKVLEDTDSLSKVPEETDPQDLREEAQDRQDPGRQGTGGHQQPRQGARRDR